MTKYDKDLSRIKRNPLSISEISWQRYPITTLPEELFECENLRKLSIYKCNLEEIGEGIGKLKNLEYLAIENTKVKSLPESLLHCTSLKEIRIGMGEITDFPTFLLTHPTLESLDLTLNKIKEIPDFAGESTSLKKLIVSNSELKYISPDLERLQNLEHLGIGYGQLSKLPDELKSLTKMKQLDFFWNPITELPSCLESMPSLTHLSLNKTRIRKLPDWVRNFKNLEYISFDFSDGNINFPTFPPQLSAHLRTARFAGLSHIYPSLTYKDFERLFKQLKAYEGTENDCLRYLHLFCGDEAIYSYSKPELFNEIKSAKETLVVQNAILALTKDYDAEEEIKEIALLGKLDLPDLRALKTRIKEVGIKLVKTPTAQTSHLYISRKIVADLSPEFTGLPFINSEQLLSAMDKKAPQFLTEKTETQSKNSERIREMLFSKEEATQQVAFEMLKVGGVPRDLLTDLYYLYQTTENPKVKSKGRALVKKYASPQLLKAMGVRLPIKKVALVYNKFTQFKQQVLADTELEDTKIWLYILRDYDLHGYALNELLDKPERDNAEILKYAAQRDNLRLRGAKQAELIPHFSESLPLEKLTLWEVQLPEFPNEVFQLKHLKFLDLKDVSISDLPKEISNLKSLTHLKLKLRSVGKVANLGETNIQDLTLAFNTAQNLSEILTGMESLKNLKIFNTQLSEIPKALTTCVNLEVLSLQCRNITHFSSEFKALKNLRELTLTYMNLEEFPEVLTQMPALRKIKIVGSRATFDLLKAQEHLFPPYLELR